MNLRRYTQEDILDLRLRSGMKKCLTRKSPPLNVRARVLSTAAGGNVPRTKNSWVSSPNLSGEYTLLSFERFAKAKAYSLQIGFLIV